MHNTEYTFKFPGLEYKFTVDSERTEQAAKGPAWTELSCCKCPNCPLKSDEDFYCPAALDMHEVTETFRDMPSIEICDVTVISRERTYHKNCAAQEGLRSLLGLIMATSKCPILGRMHPLAQQHLPFSEFEDMLVRMSGAYLISQYFKKENNEEPDWDFTHLKEFFKELTIVDKHLMKRLSLASRKDSVVNAMYTFVAFSELAEISFDSLIAALKDSYQDVF